MGDRLLLFLETIDSSNSISEAAQKLYLTQPYISRVIKKYEQEYNVLLVNRDSYPIQLTPAGQLFIKYLRKNLQLKNQLMDEIKPYENTHFSTLRMGITPPLGEKFNLAILPELLAKFPNLKTKTVELSTCDAEKAFKDEQLDLFVGNTVQLPNIQSELLHSDTQVLVLGKNSSLFHEGKREIKLAAADWQKLTHESFIVVDSEQRYQELVNNFFADIGIHLYPQIHVRDSITALKLAVQGLGNMTSSIRAVMGTAFQDINYVKLPPDKIKISFSITTTKSKNHLAAEIQLVKEILRRDFVEKILTF